MKITPMTQDQLTRLLKGESVVIREAVPKGFREPWYVAPSHKTGDTVKLGEEWRCWETYTCPNGDTMYEVEYADGELRQIPSKLKLHSTYDWQPANTMPEEFARNSAIVTGVDCKRLGKLTIEEWQVIMPSNLAEHAGTMAYLYWTEQHPDTPYHPDLWTFGVEIKIIKEGEG